MDKNEITVDENEREICCICMIPLEIKDTIRVLLCNNKHIFQIIYKDKRLSHNKLVQNAERKSL